MGLQFGPNFKKIAAKGTEQSNRIGKATKDSLAADSGYAAYTEDRANTEAALRDVANADNGDVLNPRSIKGSKQKVFGEREIPAILKYPNNIGGSHRSEIPHIMQFKIFWRWPSPILGKETEKLKELQSETAGLSDTQSKMQTALESSNAPAAAESAGNAQRQFNSTFIASPESLSAPKYTVPDDIPDTLVNPNRFAEAQQSAQTNFVNSAKGVVNNTQGLIKRADGTTPDSTLLQSRMAASSNTGVVGTALDAVGQLGIVAASAKFDQMVSIYLPMCARINSEDSFTYSPASFKLLAGALSGINAIAGGGAGSLAAQGAIALAATALSDGTNAVLGMVLNPRLENLFQQKELRSFNFSWDLYPRNQEEVQMIKDIVDTIRYHSSPARYSEQQAAESTEISDPQIILRVPAEFTVKFLSSSRNDSGSSMPFSFSENTFIPKISRCAVTSVAIDFTPGGVFTTLPDNSPTGYVLTIAMTEMSQLTREDVADGF